MVHKFNKGAKMESSILDNLKKFFRRDEIALTALVLLVGLLVAIMIVFAIIGHRDELDDVRKDAVKINLTSCMYNTIREIHDEDSYIFSSDLNTTLDICMFYEKQRIADLVYENVVGADKLFTALNSISSTEDFTGIFFPVLDMLELSNITLIYE